uniref:Uncharacterized protein n=1 Tax=Anguilla anguilla TaxID=7936 RepID=A0A0E9XC14_ANGAN
MYILHLTSQIELKLAVLFTTITLCLYIFCATCICTSILSAYTTQSPD